MFNKESKISQVLYKMGCLFINFLGLAQGCFLARNELTIALSFGPMRWLHLCCHQKTCPFNSYSNEDALFLDQLFTFKLDSSLSKVFLSRHTFASFLKQ